MRLVLSQSISTPASTPILWLISIIPIMSIRLLMNARRRYPSISFTYRKEIRRSSGTENWIDKLPRISGSCTMAMVKTLYLCLTIIMTRIDNTATHAASNVEFLVCH
ncbi:hypothetical protein M747DRAFT_300291 [Aspergillus niger ATCC 13496]|uniref:Uncharacterized protein n=1 Tax=Aspergillus niger ATCC 13496 TaxID=1353008 RepID=A0A370BI66_ASPNG|nr:hypothetical protein M747DRAFT_300291 [Aspergillus niger ATCC 13496]